VITSLTVEEFRDALPALPEGECWDVHAREYSGFFGVTPNIYVYTGISVPNGYYKRNFWEVVRGVPRTERRRVLARTRQAS
jgi:hypothetical protein